MRSGWISATIPEAASSTRTAPIHLLAPYQDGQEDSSAANTRNMIPVSTPTVTTDA